MDTFGTSPAEKAEALRRQAIEHVKACQDMLAKAAPGDDVAEKIVKSDEYQQHFKAAQDLKTAYEKAKQDAAFLADAKALADRIGLPENDGGSGPDGFKRLTLSGPERRKAARGIAEKMLGQSPDPMRKALVPNGAVTTATPMAADPYPMGRVPATVLDVLPLTLHDAPQFFFLQATTRTNAAAPVAVGGTKPTSVVGLTPKTNTLLVFAHISEPIDRYLLADSDSLTRFVADEMLYMLAKAVETEILSGPGTAGRLQGLLTATGIQTTTQGADRLVSLRTAKGALEG